MRSIETAVAWDIWARHRSAVKVTATVVAFAALVTACLGRNPETAKWAEALAYGVLVVALFATYGCFRFTEGRCRGVFGTFPLRLFHLPVTTWRLVSLPMGYGAIAVVVVYVVVAGVLLMPLGRMPPVLWPCLCLVSGLSLFQMVIWSFPDRRYGKLLLLSGMAAMVAFVWMFFLPHMIEGTLNQLGYAGRTEVFQRGLFVAMAATVPLAFVVSCHRVGSQRQGAQRGFRSPFAGVSWRALAGHPTRGPHRTSLRALFWWEWRQTGLLLPGAVSIVLILTGLLVGLSGELGAAGTRAMLWWILVSPVLLAVVLSTGFCKPDFWRDELGWVAFHAVRPCSAGDWVMVKLVVAAASVVVTWILVPIAAFLALAHAGDFLELERLAESARQLATPGRLIWMLLLSACVVVLTTWRLMVAHLWAGLSGNRLWHRWVGGLTAAVLVGLLIALIAEDGQTGSGPWLPVFWEWITRLPWLLGMAVMARVLAGAMAWQRVDARRLLSRGRLVTCLAFWIAGTGVFAALPWLALPETPWLRGLLVEASFLGMPFAGPAIAILAMDRNRSAG